MHSKGSIEEELRYRLTDPGIAQTLSRNLDGLLQVGIELDMSNLRYVKLSRLEDEVSSLRNKYFLALVDMSGHLLSGIFSGLLELGDFLCREHEQVYVDATNQQFNFYVRDTDCYNRNVSIDVHYRVIRMRPDAPKFDYLVTWNDSEVKQVIDTMRARGYIFDKEPCSGFDWILGGKNGTDG